MDDNKSPKTVDIQNSYKLSEESTRKEGNTFRNEDSIFNNKKTKKKLIKSDKKQTSQSSKKTIHIKNTDVPVNNIIIQINNQINTLHTSQNIQVNTVNNVRDLEMVRKNNSAKDQGGIISPKGFVELQVTNHNQKENDISNFKYNDRVLEASQNKFIINISRLIFSPTCSITYIICAILCACLTIISLADIFMKFYLMNTIWLFLIEIAFFIAICLDTTSRIYAMKSEYISNFLLVIVDIFTAIFLPLQIIRFANNTESTISLILHAVFCLLMVIRFSVVYIALRNIIKRQEDVRQNVEEIINFTDVLEDNHKNFDDNKNINKFTPAISFVDEESLKNKKGFAAKLNKLKSIKISNQNDGEKIIEEEKSEK